MSTITLLLAILLLEKGMSKSISKKVESNILLPSVDSYKRGTPELLRIDGGGDLQMNQIDQMVIKSEQSSYNNAAESKLTSGDAKILGIQVEKPAAIDSLKEIDSTAFKSYTNAIFNTAEKVSEPITDSTKSQSNGKHFAGPKAFGNSSSEIDKAIGNVIPVSNRSLKVNNNRPSLKAQAWRKTHLKGNKLLEKEGQQAKAPTSLKRIRTEETKPPEKDCNLDNIIEDTAMTLEAENKVIVTAGTDTAMQNYCNISAVNNIANTCSVSQKRKPKERGKGLRSLRR
ncbi:hypothetical protein RYX36_013616 [Vicia faba]